MDVPFVDFIERAEQEWPSGNFLSGGFGSELGEPVECTRRIGFRMREREHTEQPSDPSWLLL